MQFYNPAACPAGYATAGAFSFASTTTAICCQSDFSYISTFSSINYFSTSAPFDGCISTYLADAGVTTVLGQGGAGAPNTTSVSGPKDLSLFTTSFSTLSTATLSQKPTATSKSASPSSIHTGSLAAQTASPTAAVQQNSVKSTLSNSAIAGISIVGAAVIGILFGLVVFPRRRRHYKPATSMVEEKNEWVRAELDGTELKHDGPYEILSKEQVKKFHHSDSLVELG